MTKTHTFTAGKDVPTTSIVLQRVELSYGPHFKLVGFVTGSEQVSSNVWKIEARISEDLNPEHKTLVSGAHTPLSYVCPG